MQASDGAIIVSTNEGLCRYNGLTFTPYETANGSIGLTQIIEFDKNRFVARSFTDQTYVTTTEGKLVERTELRAKATYSIFSDNDGTIYRYSEDEISSIFSDGVFKTSSIIKRNSAEGKYEYAKVLNDSLYACGSESLTILPLKNRQGRRIEAVNGFSKPVLIGREKCIDVFSPLTGEVIPHFSTGNRARIQLSGYDPNDKYGHHSVMSDGKLLIATWGGLYVYSSDYTFIGKFLTDYQISAIREDKDGNIIIGTQQDGLLIIPSLDIRLLSKSFLYDHTLRIASSCPLGNSLMAFGTYDGRIVFVDDKGEFIRETNLGVKSEVQAMEYIPGENKLIAHCYRLFEIDTRTGRVIKTAETSSVKDIIRIGADTLVMGTSNGTAIYYKGRNIFSGHNQLWVVGMCQVSNGVLLNTKHGLRLFNLASKKLEQINVKTKEKLNGMVSDQNGGAFLLFERSLVHLSADRKHSILKALPESPAKSLEFREGVIWILTNESIYSYTVLNQKLCREVSKKEMDVSFGKELKFLGDHLVIVGINGVLFLNRIPIRKKATPNLSIKRVTGSFSLLNGEYCSNYEANKLELVLELLPNIAGKSGSTIRYQILNLEGGKGWKTLSSANVIALERLPYGMYVLQVVGFDELERSSNMLTIRLNIRKPFYATVWFILLCFLGLGVILYLLQKKREAVIAKKNLQKLSVERLKNRALNSELKAIRSQMNPHFIFNSINSIQTQILSHDSYRAYESLSDFATLLRQALDFTSKEYISVDDELSFLKNYVKLELIRTNNGFAFSVDIPAEFRMKSAQIPSLITQPFVENAIRHGLIHSDKAKKLSVKIMGSRENFTIVIEDNGVGRARSEEINSVSRKNHTSFASKAISERIEMINASGRMKIDLEIIDLTQGTRVVLTFKQD